MSYDAESFKAGLALGRLLWRPPTKSDGINTGLGWTADREFLIYAAGTTYETNSGARSPFIKAYDGWAICCTVTNANAGEWGGSWTWPYLISTVQNNAISSSPSAGSPEYTTKTYLGLTWYCYCRIAYNADWGGASDAISAWPVFDWNGAQGGIINGITMNDNTFLRIMQEAGVRRI